MSRILKATTAFLSKNLNDVLSIGGICLIIAAIVVAGVPLAFKLFALGALLVTLSIYAVPRK